MSWQHNEPFLNFPFHLEQLYHVPTSLKTSINVLKFTCDDNISIEFDSFGFSKKKFNTRKHIMRCNSSNKLYSLTQAQTYQLSSHSSLSCCQSDIITDSTIQQFQIFIYSIVAICFLVIAKVMTLCVMLVLWENIVIIYISLSITFSPFGHLSSLAHIITNTTL